MKKSIADVWGQASHDQRLITEATANTLREAMTACLDVLVQAQHTTGIHKIAAVGGFKDTGFGYSVSLRWSEKGDHWWTPQRSLVLTSSHGYGYTRASGEVGMPDVAMNVETIVESLAKGLAIKYIR